MLLDCCEDLAIGKIAGKSYPEVHSQILGFRTGQHIIFYRRTPDDKMEVVRFLHSRMDLKRKLEE